MRVIAGTRKRRVLIAPTGRDTRPTHDRVREALFSVLGSVADARVLDLCAGTGSLGIEALSRGARHAVFVEQSRQAFRCLSQNIEQLDFVGQSLLLCQSVESSRGRLLAQGPFDLIFCDPPWVAVPAMIGILEKLGLSNLLAPDGLFVLEHSARLSPDEAMVRGFVPQSRRIWGDTGVSIFSSSAEAPTDSDEATRPT